jgi:cell division protein FtsZ
LVLFSPTFCRHLAQINKAAEVIYQRMDPNANIIFGSLVDESMQGEIAITVIATGFDAEERQASEGSAAGSQQPAQRKLRDWEHVYQHGHAARTGTSSAKPTEDLPSFLPKLKRF